MSRSRQRKHKLLVWWGILIKTNQRIYSEYGYKNRPRWRQVKKADDEKITQK